MNREEAYSYVADAFNISKEELEQVLKARFGSENWERRVRAERLLFSLPGKNKS